MSYPVEIVKLLESGAKSYAAKRYEDAVESYGEACATFSELNDGQEDPELLYLYGKALYQIAVTNNGLFGGADEQEQQNEEEEEEEDKKKQGDGLFQFSEDVPLAEEGEEEEEEKEREKEHDDDNDDEELENKEEKGKDGEQEVNETKEKKEGGEQEEQQSDFEIAWEILDLSRSLYDAKITSTTDESEIKVLKEKLSDIYDLLGELSLETENFGQATEDFGQLLKLRESIYDFNSNLISEAHYKLSLALEFSISDNDTEQDETKKGAIKHLEKAIESIRQREEIDEDLIKELEIKLQELKKDSDKQFDLQKKEILQGILGEVTSDARRSQNAPVNDLTSIVKKRKANPAKEQNKKSKK